MHGCRDGPIREIQFIVSISFKSKECYDSTWDHAYYKFNSSFFFYSVYIHVELFSS